MSTSLDPRPDTKPEPDSDGYRGVRLDCVGTNTDQTFPPDALENPRTYGAVHQETIDQLRAAQGGGLVQVWCAAPVGAERINPGAWVSLSPQSVSTQADGMEVITAKVDACLLWNDGALEQWRYEGPSVPGVGADSGLEPPHTGAWVLFEADELANTNHLAVWFPTLEAAEWAVNGSAYIDAVATDTSESWVEVCAVEFLAARADIVTDGHFEFDAEADAYGAGYDPIDPDNPHAWSRSITDQDRALLKSLADQLNPVAKGLVAAGFAVGGPELEFNPPDYRDGFAQLWAHDVGGLSHYVVTVTSTLSGETGGQGAHYEQSSVIEVTGLDQTLAEKLTAPASDVLMWIVQHNQEHPKPPIEPPLDPFGEFESPAAGGAFGIGL